MEEDQRLSGNIARSAAYKVFMGSFAFDVPTIVLLWQENGFSMSDIMLLQALFAGALAVLEVPSGYLADKFGRSFILRAAAISLALGTVLYTQAHSFAQFFAGEMVLALGFSLASGADQALLFDSLKACGRELEFPKLWGRISALGLFSWGAFSVVGGFVGAVNLRAPLYFTALGTGMLVLAASGFKEPKRDSAQPRMTASKELRNVLEEAFFGQRAVRWIMLYPAVVLACNQGIVWLYQPYFLELRIPVQYFGVIFGLFNVVAALASCFAGVTLKILGGRGAVVAITVSLLGSFLVMAASFSTVGLCAIALQQWIRGFAGVAFAHELNANIDSRLRATTLSVQSLISRAVYAALIIPTGWWSDSHGILYAIMALAGLSAGSISLVYLLCRGSDATEEVDQQKVAA